MYNNMIKKYGAKKGKQIYYAKLNKHGLDDTEPMPDHIPKEFVEDLFEMMLMAPDKLKTDEDDDEDEDEKEVSLTHNGHDSFMREFNRSMRYWSSKRPRMEYPEA